MSKPNVTRVQSATERTASVHTLHMSKPNVTRVQSGTERTASVLLRTAKCYSTTTPVLLCTTKSYSGTTPYYKVLLHVLLHYYPSTTLYHKVLLLLCTTNQNNQPAQPGHMEAAGRPAGKEPAGRPAGDEIANKSTVLSSFWKGLPNDLPEKLLRTNYKVLHSLLLCTAKYNTVLHAQYYSVLLRTT